MSARCASAFLMLTTIWLLLGCRPDYSHEIAAVHSMSEVLKGLNERVAKMDTVQLNEAAERLRFQCGRITPLQDSISKYDAENMPETSCHLQDQVADVLGKRGLLAAELVRTSNQLTDLLADLREGRANKDSISAFIEVEFLYVEHLSDMTGDLDNKMMEIVRIEKARRPTMDSLMTVTTAKFVE
jgi:hypothetical protein